MTSGRSSKKSVNYGDGREALLEAALRLVAKGGLRALKYRTLAEEAGVTHGLIRHYFGTREALIREAIAYATSNSIDESGLTESITSLEDLAHGLVESIEDDPATQVFQYELLIESIRHPEMLATAQKLHEDYRTAMQRHLSGVGLGDDPALANLVFAALDGLVFEQVVTGDKEVSKQAIEKLKEVLKVYKATL